MQVSPDDRTENQTNNSRNTSPSIGKLITLVIAIAILGGLGYYLFNQSETATPAPEIAIIEEPPTVKSAPSITVVTEPEPKPQIPQSNVETAEPTFELPSLDKSDSATKKQLNSFTADGNLSNWFHNEFLIRRGVTFIDGLSRGIQLNKMLKTPGPKGKFLAVKEGNKLWLNPENYQRYDYFIQVINSVDNDLLVKSFHLFRPLLEEAYGELGYSPKDAGKAVIAALDQILATPIQNEPIALTRESVQYRFADPKLEALPPIQKQLLRMGPDNTRIIQTKTQVLRDLLLR